jgi:hypothetical protein
MKGNEVCKKKKGFKHLGVNITFCELPTMTLISYDMTYCKYNMKFLTMYEFYLHFFKGKYPRLGQFHSFPNDVQKNIRCK